MTSPADKYATDGRFACLVDFIAWMVSRNNIAPADARDAAELAIAKAGEIVLRERDKGNAHAPN